MAVSYQNISVELLRGYLGGVDGESEHCGFTPVQLSLTPPSPSLPPSLPSSLPTSLPPSLHLSLPPSLPSTDAALSGLATSQGWEVVADTVSIHNQEEHIKPKKILAKIEFDSKTVLSSN